jgi:hypothetical protein
MWIRVHRLPFGLMTIETGDAIEDKVGKTIEVDTDEGGSAVGKFLRIKICFDIHKPLMRVSRWRWIRMERHNGLHWSMNFFQTSVISVDCWDMLIGSVPEVVGRKRRNRLVQSLECGHLVVAVWKTLRIVVRGAVVLGGQNHRVTQQLQEGWEGHRAVVQVLGRRRKGGLN